MRDTERWSHISQARAVHDGGELCQQINARHSARGELLRHFKTAEPQGSRRKAGRLGGRPSLGNRGHACSGRTLYLFACRDRCDVRCSVITSPCRPLRTCFLAPNDVARARSPANALATSRAVVAYGASARAPRISTWSLTPSHRIPGGARRRPKKRRQRDWPRQRTNAESG
jgi:hypothetical protein